MIGGAEGGAGTRTDVHEAASAALKIPTAKMESLIGPRFSNLSLGINVRILERCPPLQKRNSTLGWKAAYICYTYTIGQITGT
jgi:hypothetical protein